MRLEAANDARHAERVVVLGAIERADDEIDDAQVKKARRRRAAVARCFRLRQHLRLLRVLNAPQQLLGVFGAARHNVGHAEIGQHHRIDDEDVGRALNRACFGFVKKNNVNGD